jgi:hypothetical protein
MSRSLPVLPLLAVTIAIMIPGCSSPPDDPPATTAPAAGPTDGSSADHTSADDLPGTIACGKAARALSDGTLMDPGVISDITHAAGSADAPVADAADHLSEAYTEAVRAHGTDAEPDAVAAVSRAAAELIEICRDSGLETVG